MNDLWKNLEEQSRTWHALSRQGLASAIWSDYVTVRFRRTGDPRALEYLYPYLGTALTRHRAIRVACEVFKGCGVRAIDELSYFTRNPDLFLRDRSVKLVASAVTGSPPQTILNALRPYLEDRNVFIRKLAVDALADAAYGCADDEVSRSIRDAAEATPDLSEGGLNSAIARIYSGSPTEEVYAQLVPSKEESGRPMVANLSNIGVLIGDADDVWFERICSDVVDRALLDEMLPEDRNRLWKGFRHRAAVTCLSVAGKGRGMPVFERMLLTRRGRAPVHHMLRSAPACFSGVPPEDFLSQLSELARTGDIPTQRVSAICLGHATVGQGDEAVIDLLKTLCESKNGAVRAAAVRGLGMAARSSCDESLRGLCLRLVEDPETAREALLALGSVFLGSGRRDVFDDIQGAVVAVRARQPRGKKHSRPIAAGYLAAGYVYLGTGSMDPVEFLLDGIPRPQASLSTRWYGNPWGLGAPARALVLIDFPESVVGDLLER